MRCCVLRASRAQLHLARLPCVSFEAAQPNQGADTACPAPCPPACRFCFTWACCPLPEATCCDDHQHCCPHSLPVCDTVAGRCLAKEGDLEGSVPIYEKQPAQKKEGAGWFPFGGRGRFSQT